MKMAKAVKSPKFNIKAKPLTSLKAWKDLKAHARDVAKVHLRTLFADDANLLFPALYVILGLLFWFYPGIPSADHFAVCT